MIYRVEKVFGIVGGSAQRDIMPFLAKLVRSDIECFKKEKLPIVMQIAGTP
ncbi:hypothetical protein [Pseudobacteriovorax antillogorgiicola]|uniref:hypothetical protein n=1 Tax=Pseudobacteriovorax antillogorgiicola TaxID=1513793 RepID=UPI0013562F00|nr:hypothetical protein [Pseudobacteriovorax antillogorgiicola]